MTRWQTQIRGLLAGVMIAAGTMFFQGCTPGAEPRPRLGSYATSTPGTNFLELKKLGTHSYGSPFFENNGIVYTCQGGHIDITHLRINADYVRYLYKLTREKLLDERTEFSFKLNVEPSRYYATLRYPENWKGLEHDEKERIVEELAIELSQYYTFTMTTWHEILTFYGFKCMYILPEEPSAFSWEDIYSNLLGVRLGAQAVQDEEYGYNKAMTILLQKKLEELGIQSAHTAWQASENMRGTWFDGLVLITMIKRNMDIGLDDGHVTPVLVPGICEGATPLPYPVPGLELLNQYGFTMTFEVQPAEFEKDQILRIVYPDGGGKRIRFPDDLARIMESTRNEAIKRGYVVTP
ncbi:MAG: DUF4056 domain-containing protein [Anaerohalosphaeraceae bacterium]